MKHPIKDSDAINRLNAAGEQTVIIGENQDNNTAPTQHVSVAAAGQYREVVPPPKPIAADPGHTRIIGYSNPATADGPKTAEPVVGWLVVLDGPGKGNHRAVYNGSNTIGRNSSQRIAIDFGDDTISSEQQAFLVYDGKKRQFQLVPNLGRPNLVHLNEAALLSNAELKPRDKITMGRTTLLFVPLCGPEFDWGELQMTK